MNKEQIQAIGNFLCAYNSDLNYLQNFQLFKKKKISAANFVENEKGTFFKFLIEFRVVRNFNAGQCNLILDCTNTWIKGKAPDDIDGFAKFLNKKGLTHSKNATSLASKILLLNNPWKVYPLDAQAKNAIGYKGTNYGGFLQNLAQFKRKNKSTINESLEVIEPFAEIIEAEFKGLKNIKTIRTNRLIDKLLWTLGK